jgi:hypothetical protein
MNRRKSKRMVEEGLRGVSRTSQKSPRERSLAELMKKAQGMIDSGVPDLATNPKYMKGFGKSAH